MLKGDCNECIFGGLPEDSDVCIECGIARKNYTPIKERTTMKYENIVRKLRFCTDGDYWDSCEGCEYDGMEKGTCLDALMNEAADAIEELLALLMEDKK